MANREENLKKINAELEKMSDEELDKVAGGTFHEVADDSHFLNSLNGSCDRYGSVEETKKGWATVGITADLSNIAWEHNKYYLNGKQITQEEARQHAMKVTGHHMTEKDWKW